MGGSVIHSRYVDRRSQRLQDRIRQYVPKSNRNRNGQERKQTERQGKSANLQKANLYRFVIRRLQIICYKTKNVRTSHYKDNQIFILSKARFRFHLSVLESIFIILRKPNLRGQREFVYKRKLL